MLGVSVQTDVAIRILLCLAKHGGEAGVEDIRKAEKLYTFQMDEGLRLLERAGLLQVSGETCNLRHAPETVSLYDVVWAVQGEIGLVQCMGKETFCPWDAQAACVMRRVMHPLQEIMVHTLRKWTIDGLVKEGQRVPTFPE